MLLTPKVSTRKNVFWLKQNFISTELDKFQIDDKNLTTNDICEKRAQILKTDDTQVSHPFGRSLITCSLHLQEGNHLKTENTNIKEMMMQRYFIGMFIFPTPK